MPANRSWPYRLALAAAGLLGAIGVMAAAGAAHTGDTQILGPLALIALTQAPAVLALALFGNRSWCMQAATAGIAIGALVFSADLAKVHFTGSGLPLFAPTGGVLMIAGWLTLVVAAALPHRD